MKLSDAIKLAGEAGFALTAAAVPPHTLCVALSHASHKATSYSTYAIMTGKIEDDAKTVAWCALRLLLAFGHQFGMSPPRIDIDEPAVAYFLRILAASASQNGGDPSAQPAARRSAKDAESKFFAKRHTAEELGF